MSVKHEEITPSGVFYSGIIIRGSFTEACNAFFLTKEMVDYSFFKKSLNKPV